MQKEFGNRFVNHNQYAQKVYETFIVAGSAHQEKRG